MANTSHYNLNKPEQTDYYDIDIHNENMDTIDQALHDKVDKVSEGQAGNFTSLDAQGGVQDSGKNAESFADANHTHKQLKYESDRMSTDATPGELTQTGLALEAKYNTTDGLNDGGSAHAILNIIQYGSIVGGGCFHQLGFTDNGEVYHRTSTSSDAWGAWKKLSVDGHEHSQSDIAGLVTALAGKASTAVATTSANGLMSSSDKSKLNGIATGAEVNVQSDWNQTSTSSDAYIKNKPSTFPPSSHSHAQSDITGLSTALSSKASTALATTSANGLMSSADKSKLNGIAAGAEVNVQSDWNVTSTTSDAYIKNKPSTFPPSSHTHNYLPLSGGTLTGNLKLGTGANLRGATTAGVAHNLIGFSDSDNIWIGDADGAHGSTFFSASTATGLRAVVGDSNYAIYHAGNKHTHTMLENAVEQQLYITASGNIIPTKAGETDPNYNPQLGNNTSRFGQIYSTNATISTSDAREKKDIADIEHAQELIMALQPRQFKYVNNQSNRTHYGFIAQEVKEAMTAAGIDDCAAYIRGPLDEEADPNTAPEEEVRYGLRYEELIAPLIATVQAQQARIDTLETILMEVKQANE